MTTQFFERQDSARSQTTRLIVLFTLAVVAIVIALGVVGFFVGTLVSEAQSNRLGQGRPGEGGAQAWVFAALFSAGALAVIGLGSLYQISMLSSGGGTRVAESVGGRQLAHHSSDPLERRLLNIVEEMAIASGTPVPPVYLLEESGINAFAAGYMPGDAVIGVTRGSIENLSRDELQGVIAHEFSHIFNGDMRTNIRLIGVLHGILVLSLIGHMLLRSLQFAHTGSNNKNSGGIVIALLILGMVFVVLGSLGSFFGGLIKAAVSRQREYLADASAVQYTRNPQGISNALRRIGGAIYGSRLQHPNAAVASHMYFAQGVFEGISGLMATHPPLPKRILAIDPNWDGTFWEAAADTAPRAGQAFTAGGRGWQAEGHGGSQSAMVGLAPTDQIRILDRDRSGGAERRVREQGGGGAVEQRAYSVPEMMAAPDQVGAPQQQHHDYAAQLLAQLDPQLLAAVHEPYSARALVMALLIDNAPEIADKQLALLQSRVPVDLLNAVVTLLPAVRKIPGAARLPLVDMALPMLRMMSLPQYEAFIPAFQGLVQADERLTTEVSILLSTLARAGNAAGEVERAFAAGAARLPNLPLGLSAAQQCSFASLEAAIAKLAQASAKWRRELLLACAACVSADNRIRVREVELVRGIADLLDCPMPPLVGRPE
jgi:Zn-dependent protease with chaperone function